MKLSFKKIFGVLILICFTFLSSVFIINVKASDIRDLKSDLSLKTSKADISIDNVTSKLNEIDAYMSMRFSYESIEKTYKDNITYKNLKLFDEDKGAFNSIKESSNARYSGKVSLINEDKTYIKFNGDEKMGIVTNLSSGIVTSVSITWKEDVNEEGSAIEVYGSHKELKNHEDLYNENDELVKLGSIVYGEDNVLDVESFGYEYIGFKSNGKTVCIDSINVKWFDIEYNNVDFKLRVGVDKNIINDMEELGIEASKFGIQVESGKTMIRYSSINQYFKVEEDEDGKAYVMINLGDVLNKLERVEADFSVCAYVEYEGEVYTSKSEKVHSIYSLVKTYYNMGYIKVLSLKNLLEEAGYEFD